MRIESITESETVSVTKDMLADTVLVKDSERVMIHEWEIVAENVNAFDFLNAFDSVNVFSFDS